MGRIITGPNGRALHIGGRRAPGRPHGIRLEHFGLDLSQWPATPDSVDYGAAPSAQATLQNICCNDRLGCCTTADRFHRQALRQAAAGLPVFNPTDADVTAIYSRDGGYVPGQSSTDQGCDEVTVLQNAQDKGIPCAPAIVDQITGFVAIDGTNWPLVRAAVSMFVGASICMGLPTAWIAPFPSSPGWTWDVAGSSVPSNGHCFTAAGQDASRLHCWSWGMPFFLTQGALAAYSTLDAGGAIYIEVDKQALIVASQKAPDGLDWAALIAKFDDAGGDVAPPAPVAPGPAVPVTQAQLQDWIAEGINSGDPLQSRAQAISNANAGIARGWPQS